MSRQFSNSQNQIKLEDMAQWHPGIATKYFEEPTACAMLKYSGSPYNLIVDCTNNSYAKCGMVETNINVFFDENKYECATLWNSLEHHRVIEFAAIGIALLLFPTIVEGKVTQVCKRGEKLDFYVNGNQFMLEVAGRTTTGDIFSTHKVKVKQAKDNPDEKNFFVFVCSFPERRAIFSYHQITG